MHVILLVMLLMILPFAGCSAGAPPSLGSFSLDLPERLPALPFRLALPSLDKPVGVLLLGSDQREKEPARSDAVMLVVFSPKAQRMVLVSIPRDTVASIPRHGRQRINAALTLGGPQLAAETVERLLGLPVDHYVLTKFANFQRIVDELEGIPVTLDRPLVDPDAGANLPRGDVRLTGSQALALARARKRVPGGDLGRAANQQKIVLGAFRAHAISAQPRWEVFYRLLREETETNIGARDALAFVPALTSIPADQVQTFIVPGQVGVLGGASVIFPSESGIRNIRRQTQAAVGL